VLASTTTRAAPATAGGFEISHFTCVNCTSRLRKADLHRHGKQLTQQPAAWREVTVANAVTPVMLRWTVQVLDRPT